MIYKQLYSELGKLLYAVADVDGTISQKEKQTLQELVKKELVPAEQHTDEFGTDVAYYTEFQFDFSDESITDTQSAFESFIDFIEDHKNDLDENMIWVIHRVAAKLAESYYHTNRKEKKLLDILNGKLDKILSEKINALQ